VPELCIEHTINVFALNGTAHFVTADQSTYDAAFTVSWLRVSQDKIDSLGGGGSRLTQIKEWLQGSKGDGEDALIIFDECHVSGGSGGKRVARGGA
jgi:hypothetical protein